MELFWDGLILVVLDELFSNNNNSNYWLFCYVDLKCYVDKKWYVVEWYIK